MPRAIIAPGEYYHIYNRGFNKQDIFLNPNDYARALFSLLFFQSTLSITNISRQVAQFRKNFAIEDIEINLNEIIRKRTVELCTFAFMPNHFHLILKELEENGISTYLQRFEIAYTKYFNTLRERSGYLFQGPFQSVHVTSNAQLLYLSAYIHRNPRELKKWKNKEHLYPWSSFQDFIGQNRWGALLENSIVTNQFRTKEEYKIFVQTSGAKETDSDLLLDNE